MSQLRYLYTHTHVREHHGTCRTSDQHFPYASEAGSGVHIRTASYRLEIYLREQGRCGRVQLLWAQHWDYHVFSQISQTVPDAASWTVVQYGAGEPYPGRVSL